MIKKGNGGIYKHRGWWRVRYREKAMVNGELQVRQPSKKLAPVENSRCERPPRWIVKLGEEVLLQRRIQHRNSEPTTTLGDFIDHKYLPYVRAYNRPSTAKGYEGIWERYLRNRCVNVWIRDVDTHQIQNWLKGIANDHGICRTTLGHIKHFLSGVFRYAAQEGQWTRGTNPVTMAVIPPWAPKASEGEAYSLEEIQEMLRILTEPAATVVETAAWTGLRAGELRGLTWDCYKPADDERSVGLLEVKRSVWRNHVGEPKTERSKAPVPVIPQLARHLAGHRLAGGNPVSGPIFVNGNGNPRSLDGLYWREMRDVLKKAGIKWKGWHGFRRGLASNLNRLGIDDSVIQAILRHSNVAVTQRCYIKTNSKDEYSAMQQLSDEVERTKCSPLVLQNEVGEKKVTIQ